MNPGIPAPFSLSRAVGTIALLVVLALTTTCVQRAYATVIVPNQTEVILTAGSGGYSTPINLPLSNSPVMVTGTTITLNHRGTGSMHVTFGVPAPSTLSWAGVNSTGTTTAGATNVIQDDILLCGTGAISIGPALGQLRAHNTQAEGFSVQVVVELIW